jgi:hypothetical protein
MSTPTTTTRTAARTGAHVSRLRALAMAERERYRNGWSFIGDRVTQRCPFCHTTVRATAPDPPTDLDRSGQYERQINTLLNDAVLDHLDHECPAPAEGQRR